MANYYGTSLTQLVLTIYDLESGNALFSVSSVGISYESTPDRCDGNQDRLVRRAKRRSELRATAEAYRLLGIPYPYFDKNTQYLDYQYDTNVAIQYGVLKYKIIRGNFNVQPFYRLINFYPRLSNSTVSNASSNGTVAPMDATTTFVLQNSTADKNGKQVYLYCTYSNMALGSSDGCITEGWWVVAYNLVNYTGAGQYSYTGSDGQTYTGFCSNLVGGFDGNAITFNFYETFFDTTSSYYGNVTFYISGGSLLQQPQSLVDNYGSFNNTYTFNWQNGNNYDPYTGAYFGGNTTTGTYYDVPLPYYTNGLSGVGADSNYFLSYTGTYSYSIILQNPLAQYWGSNQSYNYFTIPDVTNTVQLVFYPAAGSRGCYEVTSNNVIHQTAPYATGWTASAFLAQATQYVDGVLTLLSPSDATAYGIGASTGTWQIDLLCGDNSNTLSVNFYLTQRAYFSPESPTNAYYQDGQKANGAKLELDVYESYWCTHSGADFESNFFLGGGSLNYACHTSPGNNTSTWIRLVLAVGDNGDGTTSYTYYYYSFDATTGLPSSTYFDTSVTTIPSSSVQPVYAYITSYPPNASATSSALGTQSVTSQYGNYYYTTGVTTDSLPNTPHP